MTTRLLDSNGMYRTRRHQNIALGRQLARDLGLKLTARELRLIDACLKDVAFCAAFEFRHQLINLLDRKETVGAVNVIRQLGVENMLGYAQNASND